MPPSIRVFLLKAVLLFIAWQLAYRLYLAPKAIPDKFLSEITCFFTAKLLAVFYSNVVPVYLEFKSIIIISGTKVIGIANPCNALEIYVLYIGFLACFPASNRRRLLFTLLGIPLIFILNIFRCVAIAWLNISHSGWTDFSHHYIFTTTVYLSVFYLWVLFSKTRQKNN